MCCAGAYQRVLFTQLLRNGGYLKRLRVCAAVDLQWLQYSGVWGIFFIFYFFAKRGISWLVRKCNSAHQRPHLDIFQQGKY